MAHLTPKIAMLFLSIHNAMQQKDKDWQSELKYKHPLVFKYFSKETNKNFRARKSQNDQFNRNLISAVSTMLIA